MEERSKKTLEECKKLELKLAEAENRKKNMEKKYEQVGYGQHGLVFFPKGKKIAFFLSGRNQFHVNYQTEMLQISAGT